MTGPTGRTGPTGSLGLRWPVVLRAAVSAAAIEAPLGIAQQWLVDDGTIRKGSAPVYFFYFAILFCGALAGFAAGKLERTRPLPNGAAAGALSYLIVQAVGSIRHLVIGKPALSLISVAYLALMMATCGMLGAMLERRTRALR